MMIAEMPVFGDALRFLIRRKLHKTVTEFAAAADISTDTLNRALKMEDAGEMYPTTYKSIASAAGMTPQELDAFVENFSAPAPSVPERHGTQNPPAGMPPGWDSLLAEAIRKGWTPEKIRDAMKQRRLQ